MKLYTARMVHPDGPYLFPTDVMLDRDTSRDPRSVATRADTEDEASEVFKKDNPGFKIFSIEEVTE